MDATVVLPRDIAHGLPQARSPRRLLGSRSQLRDRAPARMPRSLQYSLEPYGSPYRDLDAETASSTTLDYAQTVNAWSATSSTASLDLKRESSEERDRGRCDSSLTGGTDARLSICSTSGTVYESVVVVGHVYGSDNVVYYLLEVKSWEMPLEGYVIRRRYNDFKHFHRQLALCMPQTGGVRRGMGTTPTPPTRHTRSTNRPFSLYSSSSLLCTGLTTTHPETSPLWSPTRPAPPSHRRSSITGFRLPGVEEARAPRDPHLEYDTRFNVPGSNVPTHSNPAVPGCPQWTTHYGHVDLPFANVSFNREGRPLLPPMPPGGVSSFFSSREQLVKYRIEKFNRILAAVLSDTSSAVAQLLMMFIQDKPSAPQSYVSLNQYAPVEMPWSVERSARRRATMSGKREKSINHTPLSTPVASAG